MKASYIATQYASENQKWRVAELLNAVYEKDTSQIENIHFDFSLFEKMVEPSPPRARLKLH